MPIWQGRLRGKQWIVDSSQHGCWLGSYEYDKQLIFEKIITPGSVVFDLGAHVGFYTLLASVLVGSNGKVFAFEPIPKNLFYLKQHLSLNGITNVTAIEAAVSDCSGVVSFEESSSSFQGHISSQGNLQVKTVSLDDLISKGEIPTPDYLKIDVEGAEMQVFSGAKSLLKNAHPTILLAIHGRDVHHQCCQFLTSLGYQLQPIGGKSLKETDELIAYWNR
ncbi:FkbM family methyltransferase [Coleofasciculus sp.]|uniref:FkbM family methyltransferase n=1 Tax=Coleofasciculus sp. TaxID=3100458 RepID=UPI003A33E0BE